MVGVKLGENFESPCVDDVSKKMHPEHRERLQSQCAFAGLPFRGAEQEKEGLGHVKDEIGVLAVNFL